MYTASPAAQRGTQLHDATLRGSSQVGACDTNAVDENLKSSYRTGESRRGGCTCSEGRHQHLPSSYIDMEAPAMQDGREDGILAWCKQLAWVPQFRLEVAKIRW